MKELSPPADGAGATTRAFFAAYSAHDVESMVRLCAGTALVRYVPLGKLGSGPVQTTGRKLWTGMIAALPDLTVTVKSSFGDARRVAAEVLIADYKRNYELMHAFLLSVDESARITEVAAYWDNAALTVQAGKVGVNAIIEAIRNFRRRSM